MSYLKTNALGRVLLNIGGALLIAPNAGGGGWKLDFASYQEAEKHRKALKKQEDALIALREEKLAQSKQLRRQLESLINPIEEKADPVVIKQKQADPIKKIKIELKDISGDIKLLERQLAGLKLQYLAAKRDEEEKLINSIIEYERRVVTQALNESMQHLSAMFGIGKTLH